ncbi:MAG: rod shape-determining protein MreD [Rikenellaceae bacterium]
MFRALPYIALFLTAVLSQIFIFDNLTVSVLFAPLVYVVFILLLPIESSQILMLAAGALTGFVVDAAMGTQGLNSIATLFIAFFRAPIIKLIVGDKRASERGVPSEILFGNGDYISYLLVMVVLHHAIFFGFEALSFSGGWSTILRFSISTISSLLFVWLIARIFTLNKILKS